MDTNAAEVNTVVPPPTHQISGQQQGQWIAGQPEPQGYGQPGQPPVITSQGYGYGQPWQPQVVTTQGYFDPGQPQGYPAYQQLGQPVVITAQANVPQVVPGTVVVVDSDRPPDRTVLAWLVCLFCFWPTGICAVIYAHQAKAEMDKNVAMAKTRQAQTFIIISAIVGFIMYIFIIVLRVSIA
ncbi:hypothetical protein CHS0354_020197 [Potamilus streckersoni]|uniref:Uncharacterized protein n=1 Tax=Potamilus streckersoni TaxID=2493646 RepID=A0AAE0SK60_9BIVA|nr:hypothetical protein CHS0354_020197 [Potamilus streckersoni]